MEDEFFSMNTKTEISKLIINLMGRLFPVSNNSEIMENNDCDIETNEMNHQDDKDDHKKQLKDFICKCNKSSQFFYGYQDNFPFKNVITSNEFLFVNNAVLYL